MGEKLRETSRNPPTFCCSTLTTSNTPKHGPIPLTTPNNSSIGSHISTQLHNKGPIGYNGTPEIHPQNCPFLSTITTPSNTPISWPTPFNIPNGIQIQSAVLPQYTFRTHRHTDRPTHETDDRFTSLALTLATLIDSDALTTTTTTTV